MGGCYGWLLWVVAMGGCYGHILIGACNPMVCLIHVFRPSGTRRRSASASTATLAARSGYAELHPAHPPSVLE